MGKGFTDKVARASAEETAALLDEIDSQKMVKSLEEINKFIPYNLLPYVFKGGKIEVYSEQAKCSEIETSAIPFLVTEKGMGTFPAH